MKEIQVISNSVKERIQEAIKRGFNTFINKVACGYYSISVEAPLQLHVMKLIEQNLEQLTLSKNERFVIDVEKSFPLPHKRDEVDGVIEYYWNGELKGIYLLEFKYKKPSDNGPNANNIASYIDINELEQQTNNPLIKGGYFIFVTTNEDFTKPGRRPTANRMVFPLHDGYQIEDREYKALVPDAKAKLVKMGYPSESLTFTKKHKIEYTKIKTIDENYLYYFILEIV